MKTKLELAKERRAKKQKQQQDLEALVEQIKQFHEAINDKEPIDLTELTKQLTELPELISQPITSSLEGFLSALKTFLETRPPQKQKEIDLSKLLKQVTIENKLDLKPITKEIAKLKQKAVEQSQLPEDFIPYRRVVKMGNKFYFDDNMTPNGAGGGGGLSETISSSVIPGFNIPPYDDLDITYVASGDGVGEIETVTYKKNGSSVATLTLSYNGDDKLSNVVLS